MRKHWAERLKRLLQDEGWSVAEFHRRVNSMNGPQISLSSIHKYLDGKVEKPRGDILERLAAPFGKSELWLLYGDSISNSAKPSLIPLYTLTEIGTLDPVTRTVRASEVKSVVADREDVDAGLVAVKLTDDSCAPDIKRGSTVFCNVIQDDRIEPGSLVVAKVEGLPEGVCRKFRPLDARDQRRFKLIAINPDYPDIEASPEHPAIIFGRVVKVLTTYP